MSDGESQGRVLPGYTIPKSGFLMMWLSYHIDFTPFFINFRLLCIVFVDVYVYMFILEGFPSQVLRSGLIRNPHTRVCTQPF